MVCTVNIAVTAVPSGTLCNQKQAAAAAGATAARGAVLALGISAEKIMTYGSLIGNDSSRPCKAPEGALTAGSCCLVTLNGLLKICDVVSAVDSCGAVQLQVQQLKAD